MNPTHLVGAAAVEPDAPSAEVEPDAPCRKLRTKLAFSALHDASGAPLCWQRGDGSTAVYWCLATMECAGPDDGLVHASECGPGRACYRAAYADEPEEPGEPAGSQGSGSAAHARSRVID